MSSPAPGYQYDAFLCYTDADRSWVRGHLLPALGRGRTITSKDLRPGAPKASEIERAVRESRYTVLVLTPAFLADEWAAYGEILASHLSVDARGDRLIPLLLENCELPLRVDFRVRLDCRDAANWDEEIARLRSVLELAEPQLEPLPCPYPGLVPFGPQNRQAFFGRSAEIARLAEQVAVQSYLLVVGPSGCGKSSLILGGLVPELERREPGRWIIKTMRPGASPAERLAATAEPVAPERRLLLVVDQLEEVFALADASAQNAFFAQIKRLRGAPGCTVLLSMRADFYGALLSSELGDLEPSELVNVTPLRGAALREAIVRPAEQMGVYVEERLVERLLADAAGEPGVLPMLQETMRSLWDRMAGRLLTLAAYDGLAPGAPGITNALALRGRAAMSGLSKEQRNIARRILVRLVQFGEGRADTRRQQRREDLMSERDAPADFQTALDRLVENRLLILDWSAEEHEGVRVDLAHEALITGWPELGEWLRGRRQAELDRRRLLAKAREWIRLGRGRGGLLDRLELADARRYIQGPEAAELGIDADLIALVRASRRAFWTRLAWQGGLAAIAAAALAIFGWRLYAEAVADSALRALDSGQPESALRLALRAFQNLETRKTVEVLDAAVQRFQKPAIAIPAGIDDVALDAAATRVAAAGEDGTIAIRDLRTGAPVLLRRPDDRALSVAFLPGGRRIAAGYASGAVLLWDAGADEPAHSARHGAPVTAVAAAPDGTLLATGAQDGSVVLWDARTLAERRRLRAHAGRVNRIAFSRDGRYFATAGADNLPASDDAGTAIHTAAIWDTGSGARKAVLTGHLRQVTGVAFRADGQVLATSSADGRLRLWAPAPGQLLATLPEGQPPRDWSPEEGYSDVVFGVGDALLTGRVLAGIAEKWDAAAKRLVLSLRGHNGGITALAASVGTDKPVLATAGRDGTVRIHYLEPRDLAGWAQRLLLPEGIR